MIQGKLYVYMVHMTFITCGLWLLHAMTHCIALCTRTSYFMGMGAWLESNTKIGDLVGELSTVGRTPIESNGCRKRKLVSSKSKKG